MAKRATLQPSVACTKRIIGLLNGKTIFITVKLIIQTMMNCTMDRTRARKDVMLPSTISWVCRQGTIINKAEDAAVCPLSSQGRHAIVKSQSSRILQNHQQILAKDRVWVGVIRHTPTSHEMSPVQPLVLSSSASSFSLSLEEGDEEAGGQHAHLLGQACEIRISSIRNDDCGTPKNLREK